MATNAELYEALRQTLGKDAALMLANALPSAGVATTDDFRALDAKIDAVEQRLEAKMEALKHELLAAIARQQAATTRAMLGFFMPLWVGMFATVVTLILKFP